MARKPRQTVSITEAAKRGFASRSTLYRAIKEGRLSAKKANGGGKAIDVAELVRVFGEPESATSRETRNETVSQGVSAVETERNALKELFTRISRRQTRKKLITRISVLTAIGILCLALGYMLFDAIRFVLMTPV